MTSLTIGRSTWLGRGFAGVYLLAIAIICGYLIVNGPQIHVALEIEKERMISEEDRTFCSRLGVGPQTNRYAECVSGLREIRLSHDRRNADSLF